VGKVFNALQFGDDPRSLIENVRGGFGNDTLKGNDAANNLRGNGGEDTLNGGAGSDVLEGGPGADRFEFFAGQGDDTILDFERGADRIAIADFVTPADFNPPGFSVLFEHLDTSKNGILDDPDDYVIVDDFGGDPTPDLRLDLTPFAPSGKSSVLTVLGVSELTQYDFV
jgi:Ca2+-binding RTX toxin-like protein